jgi:hypothetical protein
MFALIVVPVCASLNYTSSTPQIITKGDTFVIHGTDAKNGPVTIWIIGRNYFDTRSIAPERDGTFIISFKPEDTRKFSSGQYAVLVQDPGNSGTMEIEPGTTTAGNITIMNRGKNIAVIGPRESLSGNVQPIVAILEGATGIAGVDDTFVTDYFFIEEPFVRFDQIPKNRQGSQLPDQFTDSSIDFYGSTNMGVENNLTVQIRNATTNAIVTSKTIPIIAGPSVNRWSYELSAPGLPAGDYFLSVGWLKASTSSNGTAQFTVKDELSHPQQLPSANITEGNGGPKQVDYSFLISITGLLFVIVLIIYATWTR